MDKDDKRRRENRKPKNDSSEGSKRIKPRWAGQCDDMVMAVRRANDWTARAQAAAISVRFCGPGQPGQNFTVSSIGRLHALMEPPKPLTIKYLASQIPDPRKSHRGKAIPPEVFYAVFAGFIDPDDDRDPETVEVDDFPHPDPEWQGWREYIASEEFAVLARKLAVIGSKKKSTPIDMGRLQQVIDYTLKIRDETLEDFAATIKVNPAWLQGVYDGTGANITGKLAIVAPFLLRDDGGGLLSTAEAVMAYCDEVGRKSE